MQKDGDMNPGGCFFDSGDAVKKAVFPMLASQYPNHIFNVSLV